MNLFRFLVLFNVCIVVFLLVAWFLGFGNFLSEIFFVFIISTIICWIYASFSLIFNKEAILQLKKDNRTVGLLFLFFPIISYLIYFLIFEVNYLISFLFEFIILLIIPFVLLFGGLYYSSKKRIGKNYIISFFLVSIISIGCSFMLYADGACCGANDAKIKADLDQMRSAAEVYKIENNAYSLLSSNVDASNCDITNTFIDTNTDGDKACDDAVKQLKGGLIVRINNVGGDNAKYCIQKTLNASGSFCVDSTGYVGPMSGCDPVNYDCAK